MTQPTLIERFADNGEHSHWELVDTETHETLWSGDSDTPPPQGLAWVKASERLPENLKPVEIRIDYALPVKSKWVESEKAFMYEGHRYPPRLYYIEWRESAAPQTDATKCRKCGSSLFLTDSDAGSNRELERVCDSCQAAPQTDAVEFAEWVALNKWKRERARNGNGLWYVQAAGYGGGEPQMYTTEQLYEIFKQNK